MEAPRPPTTYPPQNLGVATPQLSRIDAYRPMLEADESHFQSYNRVKVSIEACDRVILQSA